MDEFKVGVNKYNYVYQKNISSKETRICKIPKPPMGAKAVKSIYWHVHDSITAYATMSDPIEGNRAVWEELKPNTVLSPCITAMKFTNGATSLRPVTVRIIME